MYLLNINL